MHLSDICTFSLTFIVSCVTWTALSFVRPSPTNLLTHPHTELSFRPFVKPRSMQKCNVWLWRTLAADLTSHTFLLLFQVRVSRSLMKMFKPTERAVKVRLNDICSISLKKCLNGEIATVQGNKVLVKHQILHGVIKTLLNRPKCVVSLKCSGNSTYCLP
jgi:hypothetical protein